jgi:hypothetical protein
LILELKMKGRTVKQVQCGRVLVGGGRMNGDKGEGIWLMGFIYLHEIEQ